MRGALARHRPVRCRRSASPSTSRPPTCPRKAATTICRSRSALMAAIGAHAARRARRLSRRWASWRSTARSRRSPACCRPRSARNARRRGLICPAASGAEAAWASGDDGDPGAADLLALVNHFTRHAGARAAPTPRIAERRQCHARPRRHQGPGDGQARARGRRRRRPQPADDRPARRRQVDAGGAPALDPAAAIAGRAARGLA